MRQKAITGALAIAMAFWVVPVASAAVKEGSVCKKVGQVSTVGSLKFTCVKKGSKLVWGKGIAAKSAPAMSPTPTATPIASASPTTAMAPAEVQPSKSAEPIKSAEPSKSASSSLPSYSLAKVRENNSAANCWTIIDSNVYDLTKWAAMHPGGPQVIRGLCGIDGTAAFTARHRNQSDPEATLESYLIGTLAK